MLHVTVTTILLLYGLVMSALSFGTPFSIALPSTGSLSRLENVGATLKPSSPDMRNSYSCSDKNPCTNGACCGASGHCGYGQCFSATRPFVALLTIAPQVQRTAILAASPIATLPQLLLENF